MENTGRCVSMQRKPLSCIFALIIAMASVGAARADAILDLTPSTLNTIVGGTVEFDGTLTNLGTTDLYLNDDVVILNYTDLSVDDSIFYVDAPLYLSPGDSYTGAFFDIIADSATPPGSYSGTYTIQGGADADSFDDIATVDFTLDTGAITPVPEPNPLLLIATGLILVAGVRQLWTPQLGR